MLSLCIPTNGKAEWVSKVLDSIYEQGVSDELFEVVIADNVENSNIGNILKDKYYMHNNIRYKITLAEGFLNQIEAFKMATGEFIKFVNHRCVMIDGTINYLLDFIDKNVNEKPKVYFTNGNLDFLKKKSYSLGDFLIDMYIYPTWSGGLAFWKSDFDDFLKNNNEWDSFFPHFNILVYGDKNLYIVDNVNIFKEIPYDGNKGYRYNVFYAFGVVYIDLVLKLLKDKKIDVEQFNKIKKINIDQLADIFLSNVVCKKKCDYDFQNYDKYINVFYSKKELYLKSINYLIKRSFKKIRKMVSVRKK